jgi:asparagine synthase (glutamine-hydrolysing)
MIVAILARDLGKRPEVFTVSVGEQDLDESPYARVVADHLGLPLTAERVDLDLVESLPTMIWHLDEPSDPIAACMFQAARLAANGVKVILGGDGGDELFAGFDRYLAPRYASWYRHIPKVARDRLSRLIHEQVSEDHRYKSWTQKARWLAVVGEGLSADQQFALATCFFRFDDDAKQSLLTRKFWNQVDSESSSSLLARQFLDAPADTDLDRILAAEYEGRLPEHSLMLVDRMSMAWGLEQRSPFLDHGLVEFGAKIPSRLKIPGWELKHLLRQVAADYLPPSIVNRSKQGFTLPIGRWLQKELYPMAEALILNSFLVQEGLVDSRFAKQYLTEHRSGRVDHHARLWMLMNVEIWHQLFIRNDSLETVTERLIGLTSATP